MKYIIQIIVSLTMLASQSVISDERCRDVSFDMCVEQYQQKKEDDAKVPLLESITEKEFINIAAPLRVTTTGQPTINALGLPVSINDFLPLLNFSVDPGVSDDEGEQVAFETSNYFKSVFGNVKLGVAAQKPEISDSLKEALESNNVETDEFSNPELTDDITSELSYSYSGKIGSMRFGREPETYRDVLETFGQLVHSAAVKEIKENSLAVAEVRVYLHDKYGVDMGSESKLSTAEYNIEQELAKNLNNRDWVRDRFVSFDQMSAATRDVHFACREKYESGIEAAIQGGAVQPLSKELARCLVEQAIEVIRKESVALQRAREQSIATIKASGFHGFLNAINRQPQIIASTKYRHVDDFAGADEVTVKGSIEFDLSDFNVNSFLSSLEEKGCTVDMLTQGNCAKEAANLLNKSEAVSSGWRMSGSFEYVDVDDIDLPVQGFSENFVVEGTNKFVAAIALGRPINVAMHAGLPGGKFDLGVSYEDVDGDPMREDRFVGNATYTQQISEGLQLSAGLVWANEPEFRADSNQNLSATVGLVYKFAETQGE